MSKFLNFSLFFLLLHFSCYSQSAGDLKGIYADLNVFEDVLATKLKKGTQRKDLSEIKNTTIKNVALQLLDNVYSTEYRVNSFASYLSPKKLGEALSIGDGYSKYENVTGVYLSEGKNVVLVDDIPEDREVTLLIPNWERRPPNPDEPTKDPKGWGIERQQFLLRNGVNVIDLKGFGGLAYVGYYSESPEEDSPIKVHFLNAKVNGYFDIEKHTDADWDELTQNTTYPILDALGRYIQVAYPKEAIEKYAKGRGVELISNYDSLVYRQHRILGLIKYDRVPSNRVLSRVNYNYYMFRDGDGVAYMGGKSGYAMGMVVDPDKVISGDPCWGFSHEVGHVHQTRPYFNWGGLGEVSNNVFSLYVTTSFGNKSRIQDQGNYQKARESIYGKGISYLQDEDVFNRLVPFWQLHLYFSKIENNPDFYGDLFEEFRRQAEAETIRRRGNRSFGRAFNQNPAEYQLNFVKKACEVGKVDLTDFFENYGFFYVGELKYEDYGNYHYNMTQEMVDACKTEIKSMNLPKPKTDLSLLEDE